MKKQVFKRKKLGVALIMTLMVSILAVAIASSYIGMTASSAKSARAYTKEALALSVAQSGIDMVLNIMGNPNNWQQNAVPNMLIANDIHVPITRTDFKSITKGDNGANDVNLDNNNNITFVLNNTIYDGVFADFLGPNNSQRCYVTQQPINVRYGNENQFAYLIMSIQPEDMGMKDVSGVGMAKLNTTYTVGITSVISKLNNLNFNTGNFIDILKESTSSRTLRIRLTSSYPGSIYQNVVAADFPNSPYVEQGDFGYPNWDDKTADASFLDEHTRFNGGIRIDGASDNGFGAPQLTNNFNNNNFATTTDIDRYADSDRLDATGSVRNSHRVNTAGILKISTLDNNFLNSTSATSSGSIKSRLTDTSAENLKNLDKYLPKISKKAVANQKAVYSDLVSGSTVVEKKHEWIDNVCTSTKSKFESDSKTSNIDTIWNNLGNPLLSSTDTSGTEGLYRKMMNGQTGYFNCEASSYKPDPMYANETVEVPTLRIKIIAAGTEGNSSQYDKYEIKQVVYEKENNTNNSLTGWKEKLIDPPVSVFGAKAQRELYANQLDGVIYVGGANVQISGNASQSISIISDVNPNIEKMNAEAATNHTSNRFFDDNLNSPNVWESDHYRYVDVKEATCSVCNGLGRVNGNICNTCGGTGSAGYYTEGATYNNQTNNSTASSNNMISSVELPNNNGLVNNDVFKFPTYGSDQQPSGNITIIGDLSTKPGTNPSVGLIAKNRVLLNDMTHDPGKDIRDSNGNITAPSVDDAKNNIDKTTYNCLDIKATIASESHNMCFDFNNISKNLKYTSEVSDKAKNEASSSLSNLRDFAPGDTSESVNKVIKCNTNYGMILDQRLATKINKNDDDKLVSDNGATNGKKYYYYKYTDMSQNAKKMMWADTYMGAIRPSWSKDANGRDQLPANFTPHFYTNGTLNFTGMLISRFGDINADAGTRDAVSKKRVNQLGYVNQFLDFDSNILNNCPPYFSMTNQNYWQSTSALTWNILSYVDRGSLNN